MRYIETYVDDLQTYNSKRLNEWLVNIIMPPAIDKLDSLNKDLMELVQPLVLGDDYPDWFLASLNYFMNLYLGIVKNLPNSLSNEETKNAFTRGIDTYYDNFHYGIIDPITYSGSRPWQFPAPILKLFVDSLKYRNENSSKDALVAIENRSLELQKEVELFIEEKKTEIETLTSDGETSLKLLNKEAGRIGVKKYALIFSFQSREHSWLPWYKNPDYDKENVEDSGPEYFSWKIGKAQLWLFFAIGLLFTLLLLFSKLDCWFAITSETFTPSTVVHIIGRVVFISLLIFIVSFAFKQYRVNMHQYTLNKHRANTLKSFDYLSRAPDKLEAASYNAILMEVAKAIYESGQTGYISANDGNQDMPSIIDMTKIITQSKTS
jgi:hypothetical protein